MFKSCLTKDVLLDMYEKESVVLILCKKCLCRREHNKGDHSKIFLENTLDINDPVEPDEIIWGNL